jgi:hypothetical protein
MSAGMVVPHKPKLYNHILASLIGNIIDDAVSHKSEIVPSRNSWESGALSLFNGKDGVFIPLVTDNIHMPGSNTRNSSTRVDLRIQNSDKSLFIYLSGEKTPIAILGIKTPGGLVDWYHQDYMNLVMINKFWRNECSELLSF